MPSKINVPLGARVHLAAYHLAKNHHKNILLLASSEERALAYLSQGLFFSEYEVIYLPSLDSLPYDVTSPCGDILAARAKILTDLALNNTPKIFITNSLNLISKLPSPEIFIENSLTILEGLKINIENLAKILSQTGFVRSPNAIDSGEFAIKGEIVDIVLAENEAYRISFSWDKIELIKTFDPASQLSTGKVSQFIITPASEVLLNQQTISNFKNNYIKNFSVNHTRILLYEHITQQIKYPGYEHLLPLFYEQTCNITDYLNDPIIIYDNLALQTILEHKESFQDFYQSRLQANKLNIDNFYPALPPESLILSNEETNELLNKKNNIIITNELQSSETESHPELVSGSKTNQGNLTYNYEYFALNGILKQVQDDFRGRFHDDFGGSFPDDFGGRFHDDLGGNFQNDLENSSLSSPLFKNNFIELIENNKNSKIIVIFCKSNNGLEAVKNLLAKENILFSTINKIMQAKTGIINLVNNVNLEGSFTAEKYLFIAQSDIIREKYNTARKEPAQKRLKNILAELESLQEQEYVVHKEHGIGQFLGIETIEVQSKPHDCLKILYAENAKLYVPVENIELIKKYGNFEVELDSLGSVSWQKRKAKLKNRIGDIAHKLMQVTAQRKSITVVPVTYDLQEYEKFCNKFYFTETQDQLTAIDDLTSDLTSGLIMDRLICGDVGFGKTEVALRAAFMVASDQSKNNPQIAVIVPTTILCKQHYSRFTERFAGFNLKIAQLSRLVNTKEIKQTKEEIKSGKINIIIGTHALFSKDIEFFNLCLMIIDEEQHFGVAQKEKLKQLNPLAHVLSLSATPIPRTLQMSMVGLKDLSLIATPPVDRLTIRTNIMLFDAVIIKDALLKEHKRGGKSFYVAPRISDIKDVEKRIIQLVPQLKYKIVHGSMSPLEIDKIMQEFEEGRVDILISTSIIESGIDIASANTMIIHKADQFGLAQIYQLRGRIGRGKIRGYAYLTLEKKKSTPSSRKRLEVIQTIDTLGAGFTIASHDMDHRGFGNLVGEEQSGHIKEVGVELYQDMLNEQIALLSDQTAQSKKMEKAPVNINLGLAVFIPQSYITDSHSRLGIYRRIGALENGAEIEDFRGEIIDRFGPIPEELSNLLEIVRIKQICLALSIAGLDAAEKGWVIKFYPDNLLHEKIIKFTRKFPNQTKIKPDNKLVFVKNIDKTNIMNETNWLLEQLEKL